MKREDLQKIDGLTKEMIDSIMNLHQVDVGVWNSKIDDEQKKFNDINAKLVKEQNKVTTLNQSLDKYKDVDIEGLQKAKDDYEKQKQELIDNHNKELASIKFNSALDKAVLATKTVDPIGLNAHLDVSKLKYNEETKAIDGLDEQIKSIKESNPYLFNTRASGTSQGGLDGDGNHKTVSLGDALKDYYSDK